MGGVNTTVNFCWISEVTTELDLPAVYFLFKIYSLSVTRINIIKLGSEHINKAWILNFGIGSKFSSMSPDCPD